MSFKPVLFATVSFGLAAASLSGASASTLFSQAARAHQTTAAVKAERALGGAVHAASFRVTVGQQSDHSTH